jgi:hypothetical protein
MKPECTAMPGEGSEMEIEPAAMPFGNSETEVRCKEMEVFFGGKVYRQIHPAGGLTHHGGQNRKKLLRPDNLKFL